MKTTFSAVVENGSCSPDRRRFGEKLHCGHKHRSIAAARKCGEKNQGNRYINGNWECSAEWYNWNIHNQYGERVNQFYHNEKGK